MSQTIVSLLVVLVMWWGFSDERRRRRERKEINYQFHLAVQEEMKRIASPPPDPVMIRTVHEDSILLPPHEGRPS